MKSVLKAYPVIFYLITTFLITYTLWFTPVVFEVGIDVNFGFFILGGLGPLIGAYLVMLLQSGKRPEIPSIKLFLIFFFISAAIILGYIYSMGQGNTEEVQVTPSPDEVGVLGWLMITLFCLITAINGSNAKNFGLKENYIRSIIPQIRSAGWYVYGLLFFPVLAMVAYGFGALLDMELTDYFIKFEPFWLIGFLFVLPLGGYEEFGWRGLMQKELQKKFSPLVTFLIVAFFWNAWHLPMHYNGYYSEGGVMDLLPALVFTIPLTIIIGWLYNVSRYSLIAVILLHTSNNTFQDVFGSSFFLFFVLMVLFSIFLVIKNKMWKKRDFSANLE